MTDLDCLVFWKKRAFVAATVLFHTVFGMWRSVVLPLRDDLPCIDQGLQGVVEDVGEGKLHSSPFSGLFVTGE